MPNTDDLPQVQACAIRVAVLDPNGVPSPGAGNLYTSEALTELSATPVYTDAQEIEDVNACGTTCVSYVGDDSFKRLDVALTVCTHDPFLNAMLSGGEVLTDDGINGFALPAIGPLRGNGVSIEVWAKRVDDGELHDEYPYAWWVLPRVKNLRYGVRTFNNGSSLPQFTGRAYENPNWYDGPMNDWPVTSDRAMQWFPVASLPTIDGRQTLAAS
jgi:hypothetical protein